MARVYKNKSKSRVTFRRFGVNEPRFSETKIAEMCYLYPRTGLTQNRRNANLVSKKGLFL